MSVILFSWGCPSCYSLLCLKQGGVRRSCFLRVFILLLIVVPEVRGSPSFCFLGVSHHDSYSCASCKGRFVFLVFWGCSSCYSFLCLKPGCSLFLFSGGCSSCYLFLCLKSGDVHLSPFLGVLVFRGCSSFLIHPLSRAPPGKGVPPAVIPVSSIKVFFSLLLVFSSFLTHTFLLVLF